jgi:hypothetical protein
MVQSPEDMYIICQKDEGFFGKLVKVIFSQIKPIIILVLPQKGGVSEMEPLFTFFLHQWMFTTKIQAAV